MESLSDEEITVRGQKARELRHNQSFIDIFCHIRENLHSFFDTQSADDPVQLVSVSQQLRALRVIEAKLASWESEARRIEEADG